MVEGVQMEWCTDPKPEWQKHSTNKRGDRKRRKEREKEREKEKVVISHPCSMQRKFNFHISSTTETKNIKQ